MTGREKFEAWFRADIEDDDEYSEYGFLMNEDEYRDEKTDIVWAAWQASRKQALEEALDVCSKLGDREENIGRHSEAFGCDLCVHALACLANAEGEQG